jgi:5'-deoxynucleotidase YfbR-like HD superfamily hydrolase
MRGSEAGNRYSPTGIEELTRSGEMISLLAPRPEQIHMKDIAAHLAAQVRFNGACPLQPTIAQHSLAVEYISRRLWFADQECEHRSPAPIPLMRAALCHDAAEYLVGDNIGAVKKLMRDDSKAQYLANLGHSSNRVESTFDKIEDRVQAAIVARFDCADTDWEDIIHEADCVACAYEMSWAGWCPEAKPPEWARLDVLLEDCYGLRELFDGPDDCGEAAFIARAAQLGMVG